MPQVRLDQPSVIAGYAFAIARTLEQAGVESHRVFRMAGLSEAVSNDPLHRLNASQISTLYHACVEVTGDAYFGLKVAKYIQPSNFHTLGYALLSSGTLREFCERLVRYLGIVTQSATPEFRAGPTTAELRFQHRVEICYPSEDAFLAFLMRFIRVLRNEAIAPQAVTLRHACPPDGDGPYRAIFGVVPTFDSEVTSLSLPASILDDKLPGACGELAAFHDKLAGDYLARLNDGNVVTSVRTKILSLLPTGDCSRARVANQMHISEPALQAKLAKCGTSFQDILEGTRKDLATAYMVQRGLSVTQIALALGFTETSNFTRAFRRWTGHSPSEFRRQQLHQPLPHGDHGTASTE